MTTINLPANKNEPLPLLYYKALDFIEKHAERKGVIKNGIVPFPEVYHALSTMMHLRKEEAIGVFEEMRDAGVLEVVPFRGLRLKNSSRLGGEYE